MEAVLNLPRLFAFRLRTSPLLVSLAALGILASVARRNTQRPKLVIGFAAETDNVITNAKAKLAKKKLPMSVKARLAALEKGRLSKGCQVQPLSKVYFHDELQPCDRHPRCDMTLPRASIYET